MKILTFSFDDCEIYDRQLCQLLRKYGMKATFYLISGQLGIKVPFHRYGKDTMVERVNAAELSGTYRNMEIASHTRNHRVEPQSLSAEVEASLRELSEASGQKVCGFAWPGGQYTPELKELLRQTSVMYARGAQPSHDLSIPKDWYDWQPTCHYAELETPKLIEKFLTAPAKENLLLHIFGHSYELTNPEKHHNWTYFEKMLKQLADRRDICCLTNGETMRQLNGRNSHEF